MTSCSCGNPENFPAMSCPTIKCTGAFHLECLVDAMLDGRILRARCQSCRNVPELQFMYQQMHFNVMEQEYMNRSLERDINGANDTNTRNNLLVQYGFALATLQRLRILFATFDGKLLKKK